MRTGEPDLLVTGATGFVGTAVLRELIARGAGARVRVLARRPLPAWMTDAGVTTWRGDITDAAGLAGLCTGITTLVHLASQIGGDAALCTAVNEDGTAKLLAEARRAGTTEVLYLSTCAVYRDGVHRGAPEPVGEFGSEPGSGLGTDPVPTAGRGRSGVGLGSRVGGGLRGGLEALAGSGGPGSGLGAPADRGESGAGSGSPAGRGGSKAARDSPAGRGGLGTGLGSQVGGGPGSDPGAPADRGESGSGLGSQVGGGWGAGLEALAGRGGPGAGLGSQVGRGEPGSDLGAQVGRGGPGSDLGAPADRGESGSGSGSPAGRGGSEAARESPAGHRGSAGEAGSGSRAVRGGPWSGPDSPAGRGESTDQAGPGPRAGRRGPSAVGGSGSSPAAGGGSPATRGGPGSRAGHDRPTGEFAPQSPLATGPASATSRSRLAGERLVLAAGGVVLRPHLVHGAGDRHVVPALARWISAVPAWAAGGEARTSLVAVADLAAAIAVLALNPGTGGAGEVFHVADPDPVRLRVLITAVCELLGLPVPVADLPLAEHRARTRAALPALTDHQYSLLTRDHWYESTRIWDLTGVSPGPGFGPRLAEAAAWYRTSLGNVH